MSDLLSNWLNDEIQLSKRIYNFEEDFHNGFLIGQLLSKYSQQLNFHQFIDKDDKSSRIRNFSLLIDTFTALKVPFDSNLAMKIINKQLGVAKKLLYELKTQLQKTNTNAISKTTRMNKTLSPLKKIQISKDKYDQVNKEHFVKQLNELHPAQKKIIQDQVLKKFGDFQFTSTMKAMQEDEKDRQASLLLRSKFNQQQRDNLKKSEQFRRQWEAEHLEKWGANMTIRQIQVMKDQQFASKIQQKKVYSKTMSEMNALKALESDIAQFERRNLNKIADDSDEQQNQTNQQQSIKALDRTTEGIKIKQQARDQKRLGATETEKKKHQREKRRRKMIVQQQKRYQMIQITRRERCIIGTIQQTSKQQKQIQYQIWRAWQNKNIIAENKHFHHEKVKEKDQTRQINAKFKRDELLKLYREEHRNEVAAALKQNTLLQRNNQVSYRKTTYNECQKIIHELLNISEDMYVSCQDRNSAQISLQQLEVSFIKFVQGVTSNDEVNAIRLKHYVEGSHQWNIPIVKGEQSIPNDPKQDNALPTQYVNNYFLGNILRSVFEKLLAEATEEKAISSNQKLLISIVGLDFAGKHTISQKIASQHGFNLIQIEKLIGLKVQDWQNLSAKGIQVSKQTEQLALCCLSGKYISDAAIINLIKEEIDKHPNNILIDYPNTYEQALQLCRVLGNVQPNNLLPKNKLFKKMEEFQRLVKCSEAKIIQRQMRECGIDFVWWIDTSVENSVDRMLGRRWIDGKQVHINDDIEPYNLKEKEKASALVIKNHFKLKNKQKLAEWFSLFGTQFQSSQLFQRKCWQQIEGNFDIDTLQTNLMAKLNQILTLKAQQNKWKGLQKQEQQKRKQLRQEQQNKIKQIKQKCVHTKADEIKQQMTVALSKAQLDRQFVQKISDLWNRVEQSTINSLNKAFQGLQQQQRGKKQYLAQVKRSFISLLTRQDHKFLLIKTFQQNYNKFVTQNEDMLAYDYTRQQMHQRVEDLQNDLLAIVEQKKQDAISERSGVMTSGWLQSQMQFIQECLFVIVQTELNRFASCQKIIVDYYSKKFMANTKSFEPLQSEINVENLNSLQIFKDNTSPRLDKLISEAIRILNRQEDISDDKNKKGGKGAPPKKDDKKTAKKGGKDQVQENKEPTAEELQMKKAINIEKAILRQRFNRIKTMGSKKLKNTSQNVQKLYAELQDLYLYTFKTETKAVLGMTNIFKKAIEKQQKIESQVRIHHVEVTQTQHIRNFEMEKPIILPARETISDRHFTLSNLNEVFKLLKEEAQGSKISTKRLIILLKKLISNQQLRKLIPETWKKLTSAQMQNFVKLLDHNSSAYVDLVTIYMFFILTGFTLPTQEQFQQFTLGLTNYSSLKQTTLDKFIQTQAWFDEFFQQKQNTRSFLRNHLVKTVLFNIFKRETDDHLEISRFLAAIKLTDFQATKLSKNGQTYYDYAFL